MANSGREISGVGEEALAGAIPSARGYNPWDARSETILIANHPPARLPGSGAKALALAGIRGAGRPHVTEGLHGDMKADGSALRDEELLPDPSGIPGDGDGMDRVMAHLREHFRENVPMKALADLVRLSLRQFHRNFKKRFGMPPNQYLIRMRVLAARDMLLSDKRPVAKIAYDLGFADDTLFIRQFKARMGMTPLQYRKAHR